MAVFWIEYSRALIFQRLVLLSSQRGGGIQSNKGVLHNQRPEEGGGWC